MCVCVLLCECVCVCVCVCFCVRYVLFRLIYKTFIPSLAEIEESRQREESARSANSSMDDTDFPNKRRNMILGAIFALTAMTGYAFASGLLRMHMLEYQSFGSPQGQENINNSAGSSDKPQPPDLSAKGFDPLFQEQSNNQGEE